MTRRLLVHLRHNIVGYVALFLSLGMGTAWAGHEMIFSNDIVNGEVKKPDVGVEAVGTEEVEQNSLAGADVASSTLFALDINSKTFDAADISAGFSGFFKYFHIPTNAIQSHEIQNGEVKKEDLATSAGPRGFSLFDSTPGFGNICNAGCTEGTLALPAGSYAIFAKIWVYQSDIDESLLHVTCELHAGTDVDTAVVRQLGDSDSGGPLATNPAHATLPMQVVHDYGSAGNVSIGCRDQDIGDARSKDLRITAIELGSSP